MADPNDRDDIINERMMGALSLWLESISLDGDVVLDIPFEQAAGQRVPRIRAADWPYPGVEPPTLDVLRDVATAAQARSRYHTVAVRRELRTHFALYALYRFLSETVPPTLPLTPSAAFQLLRRYHADWRQL